MKNICDNIKSIKNTIGLVKNVSVGIELVVVTKGVFCQDVLEAIKCGIKHIGESKIQEALPKFKQLGSDFDGITKHFIGRLQSNKVKRAVEIFDLIQSLDSLKLAIDINRHAADINKVQNCLIEVKVSQEATKIGVSPKDVKGFYEKCQLIPNILIKGLMVIMPLSDNPKDLRFYFRQAHNLFEDIKKTSNNSDFSVLSMGMSDDYKIAIEEGSTMVRIGSAIFGERDYGNK
ncbi:MAG: YggS family pyridoxal phosphate-dependent enzyme [Endomicrobium sp.]|jgi:pyridoxal phosphate enzyme (YggS family)|nr:YggS family pyridoxal phosphate-dependent enzyme [Endomicrobium sp.]